MPRRNPRRRLAGRRAREEDSPAGEDSDVANAMAPPTSDVEMEDALSGGDASAASMSEEDCKDDQVHEKREVPQGKRVRRRRPRGASSKSPSRERDEDADKQLSDDEMFPVAKRAMTRKRRKQLDTPMQPRSRVRFGVGKNVIARIGRGWKVGWIVDISTGKVCVRWHTGERRNKGMDEKWVKTTRVHVMSRAQMFALEQGSTTVEQLVKDIEEM